MIIIAGPPRAGKDTLGQIICLRTGWPICPLSVGLKDRCHQQYGLDVSYDHFEMVKEEAMACFNGLSPRAAYSKFVTEVAIPKHGPGILGFWAAKRAQTMGPVQGIIFPDTGRLEEAAQLAQAFGYRSTIFIRVDRPGCTFQGDPREPFTLEAYGVPLTHIMNPGNGLDNYVKACKDTLPFLKEK